MNGDGAISVNELNKYLFAQIYIFSFGNQSSIVQSELADYDWALFHLPK
ncbi:MAG: hypothetical protein M3139_06180 [Bacteroidota bacterium]|nr:hypothetical protein [Bacteroidota bacterium]